MQDNMTGRVKPIGSQVLIEVKKKKSTIELLPGTQTSHVEEEALVVETGTVSHMGIRKGHSIMFKAGAQPMIVEETDEKVVMIAQEVQIMYVKNWTDEDEAALVKGDK